MDRACPAAQSALRPQVEVPGPRRQRRADRLGRIPRQFREGIRQIVGRLAPQQGEARRLWLA